MTSPRVVITGLGLVTPVGTGTKSVWSAVLAGRTGIARIRGFDPVGLPVQIGAEILDFDAKQFVDKKERKSLKNMARTVQLGVAAARVALDEARIERGAIDPERVGVVYGSGTIPGDLKELADPGQATFDPETRTIDMAKWGAIGMGLMPPMWLLFHVPNMTASHVAILNNARGPCNTVTQTDAAGLLAIGEGIRYIRRDAADVVLAGGADTRTDILSMFRCPLFTPMSRRNDDPEQALRPFDADRDGTVHGEGGGILVLEKLDHARRREADIYGEIVGYAAGFDRGLGGEHLARIIRQSLNQAGIEPSDLDHVNALASGDRDLDAWEAKAIRATLGEVPVVSYKPNFSHLGAGADATELAVSLLALKHGELPGTLNYHRPDPECPVNIVTKSRPVRSPYILKLAGTERGQCAALVVRSDNDL